MSATVHKIRPAAGRTLGDATDAYLATIAHNRNTLQSYGGMLKALVARFGEDLPLEDLDPDELAAWVTEKWNDRANSTWNRALTTLRAAVRYWTEQGWLTTDPVVRLKWRRQPDDRTKALSRRKVARIIDDAPSLRDKLLWTMLYESAARIEEVLALDVEDLDVPNRSARVRRKGGAIDVIMWQTGTARLLADYLKVRSMNIQAEIWQMVKRDPEMDSAKIAYHLGITEQYVTAIRKRLLASPPRKRGPDTGPLFLTERRARVELPPSDIEPESGKARLGYKQAWRVFSETSGGANPHQLRHSALTHAAEDGASTPMLMAMSGHTSVQSLVKYARISPEAMRQYRDETDPASRRKR